MKELAIRNNAELTGLRQTPFACYIIRRIDFKITQESK